MGAATRAVRSTAAPNRAVSLTRPRRLCTHDCRACRLLPFQDLSLGYTQFLRVNCIPSAAGVYEYGHGRIASTGFLTIVSSSLLGRRIGAAASRPYPDKFRLGDNGFMSVSDAMSLSELNRARQDRKAYRRPRSVEYKSLYKKRPGPLAECVRQSQTQSRQLP